MRLANDLAELRRGLIRSAEGLPDGEFRRSCAAQADRIEERFRAEADRAAALGVPPRPSLFPAARPE